MKDLPRSPSAGGGVWTANQYAGTVSRIDSATNTVARRITVGNRPAGIAVAGGVVWLGTQAEATSHRGGTLTVLSSTLPADLDPTADTGQWLLWWTGDGLTAYRRVGGSASAQVVPDLAASLPSPTDNGKAYTFQLRRGIRYSNGAPVRPEDFRQALERDLKLGPNPLTGDYFANVIGGAACTANPSHCDLSRGVVVNDRANTVTFHLAAPNPEFLDRLTLADAYAVPVGTPARDIGQHPIPVTGPYEIASITPAQTTLVRNPYFHEWSRAARPDGHPDKIVVRLVKKRVRRGDGSRARHRRRRDGSSARESPRGAANPFASQLHIGTSLYEDSLILNTRVAPFDDIRVRRALNYAVDRAEVARLVGPGAQPTCQTLTPWFTGYDRYCPYTLHPSANGIWRAPDLPAARRLINASHTRPTPVTIWLPYSAPTAAGRYFVALFNKLGYRARLRDVSTDPTGYAQIADSRTKAQAFLFFNYAPYPSASQLINIYFGCKYFVPNSRVNGNIAEFCDPRLDADTRSALAAEANSSPDVGQLWAQPTAPSPTTRRWCLS